MPVDSTVGSFESRVEKCNELAAWLISVEINIVQAKHTLVLYMRGKSKTYSVISSTSSCSFPHRIIE